MTGVAVAAISARVLAEAASRDGFEVVALDLFGDRDTRRAASRWAPIGEPGSLRIDGERLLDVLRELARGDAVQGWVAGSGFEGRPDLLEAGAACLPLLGNDAARVRRVRDPRAFFALLDAHGIAHPEVAFERPDDPRGWLRKDASGCGGWHIRRAAAVDGAPLSTTQYHQRERRGTPMSATFVGNGREALLLGCNEQIVQPVGDRPHVYAGVIGPLAIDDTVQAQVRAALQALVAAGELSGLGSLDFLLVDDRVEVLELNPRPPASLALYPRFGLRAHCSACERGDLPAWPDAPPAPRGERIVYARRPMRLGDAAAATIAAQPDTHDLPQAGASLRPGDPLCSVGASGRSGAEIRERLAQRADALLNLLENIE